MKTLLCLLLLLLAPVAGAEEKAASWPPEGYVHVVGFCYDHRKDPRGRRIVFPDGTLHRGIIKATTVRFSKAQTERLVKILTTKPKEDQGMADCYEPHHGFVFYGNDWKAVGWFEVCFLCSGSYASSGTARPDVDYKVLEAFTREAGLPVLLKDRAAYSKLYEQENPPPSDEGKKPPTSEKPAVLDNDDPFRNPSGE